VRNLPSSPKLSAKAIARPPRVELVIVCEGANTEPAYFKDCATHYGAGTVRLKLITAAGVPLTLVKGAIQERQNLINQRKRYKDSFDSCFRVWAVFDRDDHPNVAEALALAECFGIDVAFSNPCFELWPVLHLVDFGAQMGRHALQAYLKTLMPTYDHQDRALIDFGLIKDRFVDAYVRALKHNLAREEEQGAFGNPSTTVCTLVRKIVENGKFSNQALVALLNQLPRNEAIDPVA